MAKALTAFHKAITRSEDLLTVYTSLSKDPAIVKCEAKDLLRSALVMAVAGMDAYFTGRFTENIVVYLKTNRPTDGMVKILSKAGLDTRQALEMIAMDRPWRRIRTLLDDHLFDHTTQRFDAIDDLFVVYKVKDLCTNAEGLSKRKELLKSVELAVQRRHAIVHRADINGHDKLNGIELLWTRGKIADVKLFVEKCETLIAKVLP